jgi:electron transport complex protein RnfC
MECGCCSYICPSHIPLADLVRQARQFPREGGEQE